jgi:hypothetical protein
MRISTVTFGAILATVAITPAHAALTSVDIGKSLEYQQTGNGGVGVGTAAYGTFFSARAFEQSAGDFDGGTLTYPGPASPVALTPSIDPSGPIVGYQTPYLADQATLDAAFPFGIYGFHATNSGTAASQDASLAYTADTYTASVAEVANFAGLHALKPGVVNDLQLVAGFGPGAGSVGGRTFVTLYDYTSNGFVYGSGVTPASSTDFFISANTLTAGHQYGFEVIFSDFVNGFDPIGGIRTFQFFDVRTRGLFTLDAAAAIPEPAAWTLLIAGFGLTGVMARRRRISVTA